jgi:hypothetical protein
MALSRLQAYGYAAAMRLTNNFLTRLKNRFLAPCGHGLTSNTPDAAMRPKHIETIGMPMQSG